MLVSCMVFRSSSGTMQRLNGIQQLEIWTDGKGLGHGWYADYVIVTDNKTGEEACFLINEYLNKENGGVAADHLILDKQPGNVSCRAKHSAKDDDLDTIKTRRMQAVKSSRDSPETSLSTVRYKRTYHVDTRTGDANNKSITNEYLSKHVVPFQVEKDFWVCHRLVPMPMCFCGSTIN